MNAAVLHSADGTPRAESFPDPTPQPGEVIARVLAAGLHPLVRGQASGRHYTSTGVYPLIPGVDGVAELPDGRRGYIGWLRAPYGTFAELAAVSPAMMLPLPAGLAPELGAAIVNPAMSGWLALKLRARLVAGERVLILGATGAAGQLAVQVARTLGASKIIAAGRNAEVLNSLKVDATVRVDAAEFRDHLAHALAGGVDVVLDYLWGPPAHATFEALLGMRAELAGKRVRYVNIGEMAGAHVELSPHVLRSMDLELSGSGFGSVSPLEIRGELPKILDAAARGELSLPIEPVPLARVGEVWIAQERGKRVVIVP
ncbi:MAG TPA: zinc-binding alcohol dehydrogenase family protein [Kofleriaceae bacterium]|jgi:NADPH2:quinone reductase